MTPAVANLRVLHRLFLILPVLATVVALFMVRDLDRTRHDLTQSHELVLRNVVQMAISTIQPYYDRQQNGQLTREQAQAQAKDALRALAFDGPLGFIIVNNSQGVTQVNRTPGREGKNLYGMTDTDGAYPVRDELAAARAGGGFSFYRAPPQADRGAVRRMAFTAPFRPWDWSITAAIYADDLETEVWHAARVECAIAFTMLLAAGAAVVLIARTISRPMATITLAMASLADGQLTIAVPFAGQRNEFGRLAAALAVFKDNALSVQRLREEQDAAKRRAEIERQSAIHALADDFQAAISGVVQSVAAATDSMQSAAGTLSENATTTARQADAATRAASDASDNVASVAAATEQLAASFAETGRQLRQSAAIARDTASLAAAARNDTAELTGAAHEIEKIIGLIRSIADQTNFLALNATIEASRAGEAGRGFAVVASEVKTLAAQVARATTEIQTSVAGMQLVTTRSAGAVAAIAEAIGKVSETAEKITALAEQQGIATVEIARNIQRAAAGTSLVSSNVVGAGAAAGQTKAEAARVMTTAQTLATSAAVLREAAAEFLAHLRAA